MPVGSPEAILGHESVKVSLRQLRLRGVHALLFIGAPSLGKRLVAQWYAQWCNCLQAGDEPCGRCPSCLAMQHQSHPDYREIVAERSTKTGKLSRKPQLRIDDLVPRSDGNASPLTTWLEQRPRFAHRVGVIDGAETLNVQAANAFLKMLEEPPSYASIILISSSEHRVLATLRSRCTILRFRAQDIQDIDALAAAQGIRHPAARLGRVGDIVRAAADPEEFRLSDTLVQDYLEALRQDLDTALTHADALEKAWSNERPFAVAPLLRAHLSNYPPALRPLALEALEQCEAALEAYASPGIAVQVLTLALRALLARA